MDYRDLIIKELLDHIEMALDFYREEGYWSRIKDIGWTFAEIESLIPADGPKPYWQTTFDVIRKDFF